MTLIEAADAIFGSRLAEWRKVGPARWSALCPSHDDREPSLSVDVKGGKVLVRCHAGCKTADVLRAIGLGLGDLRPERIIELAGGEVPEAAQNGASPPSGPPAESAAPNQASGQRQVLTVAALAAAKGLPADFLEGLGVQDLPGQGIAISYWLTDGTPAPRQRVRTSLDGGFSWSPGDAEVVPYGLWKLDEAKAVGCLVLVEGESDSWTLWHHGIPALGLPGADTARVLKPEYLDSISTVYIVKEQDEGGHTFVQKVPARLRDLGYTGTVKIVRLVYLVADGVKDPNDLHRFDPAGFPGRWAELIKSAAPPVTIRATDKQSRLHMDRAGDLLLKSSDQQSHLIVDGILPIGLTLLAAPPKKGKSWLATQLSLAVAQGQPFLGQWKVRQGRVLYLALEDPSWRVRERLRYLLTVTGHVFSYKAMDRGQGTATITMSWHIDFDLLNRIYIVCQGEMPTLDVEGLGILEDALATHPGIRLAVVDSLGRVKPEGKGRGSSYDQDYASMSPLQDMAHHFNVAVLAVTHTRKEPHADWLYEVQGSAAMSGVADAMWVLKGGRGEPDGYLHITGRDVMESDWALRQARKSDDEGNPLGLHWELLGSGEEHRLSSGQAALIALLDEEEELSPQQAAKRLGCSYDQARSALRRLEAAQVVKRTRRGLYRKA